MLFQTSICIHLLHAEKIVKLCEESKKFSMILCSGRLDLDYTTHRRTVTTSRFFPSKESGSFAFHPDLCTPKGWSDSLACHHRCLSASVATSEQRPCHGSGVSNLVCKLRNLWFIVALSLVHIQACTFIVPRPQPMVSSTQTHTPLIMKIPIKIIKPLWLGYLLSW